MSSQPLVFPHGPSSQELVEVAKGWIQGGLVETTEVLDPATQDCIPHARQVVDGLVATQGDSPAPHLLSHLGRRSVAHGRSEAHEELPPPILRPTRPERVPEEVKLLLRMPSRPIVILAVDDPRLLGMHFQPTVLESTLDSRQNLLRLLLRLAVRDDIVGVPLERNVPMHLSHPVIEREMQKHIGQKGTDDSSLRRPLRPRCQRPILQLRGRFQPPLHVERDPPTLRVLPNPAHHQRVVEVVEKAPDVQVNDPGVAPASLSGHRESFGRRLPRPVPVRVPVEIRLHRPLQVHFDNRLGHPICNGRDTQPPLASALLWNANRAHRRWKVRPRRHAIPDLVQVVLQIPLEGLDTFGIDTGRSAIRLDPLVRLHHHLLGNTERLRLARRLLPLARLTIRTSWMTRPLRSIGSPRLRRSYGSLRPCASHRYAHPRGSATWISPLASRRQVPTFRTRAWLRVTPPLCRVSSRQAAGSPWTAPGPTTRPGFDTVLTLSTRSRWFTAVRLSEPYLTRSRRAVSGHAHHPGSLPEQLPVVWSLLCQPAPRGRPSSLVQPGCIEPTALLHHGLLSAPSWRTVVRVPHDDHVAAGLRPPPPLDPEVEHVVQVHVAQERRYAAPLGRALLTPCPRPGLQRDRVEPFLDQPHDALVRNPMLDKLHHPSVVDGLEVPPDVGVEHPVHLLRQEPGVQRIQRVVRAAPQPKTIGEAKKVGLVDRVQHLDRRALDDLVFQRGDAQRPQPPVGLGDVRPLDRLRSIRPALQPFGQVREVRLEGLPVVLPRLPVDPGGGVPLQRVVRRPQMLDVVDVVQQRREPHRLVPLSNFTYPLQRTARALPVLRPERVLLARVPFGQAPSLHPLRSWLPSVVRRLRRYNGPVRLPLAGHRQRASVDFLTRPAVPSTVGDQGLSRFSREVCPGMLGVSDRAGLPSASRYRHPGYRLPPSSTASASRRRFLSRLNTRPARSPVNASLPSSRTTAHDSGPVWIATPSPYDSFIRNTSPV